MSAKKAQIPFEYIAKILIILLALAVIIGMIYSEYTREKWIIDPTLDFHRDIFVVGPFNASDFANFIELCWEETRDAENSSVCFVLKGSYIDPTDNAENDIKNQLDTSIKNNVVFIDTDFNNDLFSINYEIVGNEIHVKS